MRAIGHDRAMRRIAIASVSAVLFASALVAQSGSSTKSQDIVELAPLLDEFCKPLVDSEVALGLVVGVIDGDRREVRGYGKVHFDADGAPDADTLFEIGSASVRVNDAAIGILCHGIDCEVAPLQVFLESY